MTDEREEGVVLHAEAEGHEPVADAPEGGAPVEGDAEVEAQARRMGWVPRDDFRGDVEKWRPARDFLDRGMNLLPVLQQQYRALDGRYATMQAQLRDSQKALADLTERTRRADERAYQRAVRDIEGRRQAAVASGDTTAFAVAERDLQDLRDTAPPAPAPVERVESMPPEIMDFVQANPWFSRDAEARQDAIAIQSAVDRQHPGLSLAERLEITRRKVRQLHPALFENKRREAPPPVSPSRGEGGRGGNPRGFEALPAEARREYDRYARALAGKGKPLTKDEWAGYYWENDA
ncbi:hypothetical protein HLH36_16200 [Gluconacetobacter aggeris]|uniref:Uncharacterized protein n=1 Tax=Gluconacetobacter aggeris TaxID=1286186 RepID=A0A7W4IVP9_9PROT|nr:hypothetical protein [Gluconacetobacter aggeris]MBB2169867.1 hypothetical protein [Gluconacetobacter aggeris]